jgi:hypothetical protein
MAVLLLAEVSFLALHFTDGKQALVTDTSAVEAMGFVAVAAIRHPPISAYNEVTRRPLFEEDRRQIVASTGRDNKSAAARKFASNWRLTGVAIGEERSVAILENTRSGEVLSLATGDSNDGWAIDHIDSNRVVIRSGVNSQEFVLDKSVRPDVAIARRNGVLVRTE